MMNAGDIDFSTVLASSVHDMKNSVGMLLASVDDLLRSVPEDSEQAEQMNILQYEASRINNELVQLLSIYRLQQDRLPMHIDDHFIQDILDDQVARNYPLIQGKGVELTVECDPDLEAYLDADLVGSVVQNVVVNGCRYTNSQLRMGAEWRDDMLCIWVADDGEGFPEDMIDFPTEPQLAASNSTQLGLYFAGVIARLHKAGERTGYITLRNGEPLGGGVFELYIPN